MKLSTKQKVDLLDLKNRFKNTSLLHGFYEFGTQVVDHQNTFYFPLKQIRSFKRAHAHHLYKHISRTIDLEKYKNK